VWWLHGRYIDDINLFSTWLLTSELSAAAGGITPPASGCYGITSNPFQLVVQNKTSNVTRLETTRGLFYDRCQQHYVTAKAVDQTGHFVLCTTQVKVLFVRTPPYFINASYDRVVKEDSAFSTIVGDPVTARDRDPLVQLTYTITGGTGASLFGVKSCSGQIYVKASKLSDPLSNYTLFLNATDDGIPTTLSGRTLVNVTVLPVNHPPYFTNTTMVVSIDENKPAGTPTAPATLPYYDKNGMNQQHYWAITGGATSLFAINNLTGVITATAVSPRPLRPS
jgi:hypothetical protein